ncbi:hypothetical protein GWA97_13745, partial [Flavobacterium sp. LaA7.5]|nr:hypothetical protein [Flavobacterium salilacus subsp. altitudinum]
GTAGYTYDWTPGNPTGDGTTSVSGLSAGTWTCTVTDANGCTDTQSFTITEPTVLSVAAVVDNNETCANNDGAATAGVTGGTSGYTYLWSNGATTASITGLIAGTYTVTVTDANGCTATDDVTITSPTNCATLATVTTDDITVYTATSFTVGGNVTDDGNAAVTDRGVVYSTSANPTTADSTVQIGMGEGAFSQSVSGLTEGVTYYVRAYATNSEGTAYGNEVVFTTPYGIINLVHNATSTQYPSIQQAVDASVTGDMVTLGAGTYIEQVTVTTGITIQGAGTAQTTVRSPLAADLIVNGGWKTLKAQDVVAIIGVKTDDASQVTIKDLTVDGFDQGYLPDATYPDKNAYAFQGIGALNSNVIVDNVSITGVRELATDFGATIPAGYLPADQPSGINHNEAIFAESAVGAGSHTLEVKNSYIEKFQKTAILAWGPTLEVNIHDNTIQGYGQTLYSTGNGIQIASTDRTSLGGANGDRRGTTGIITNNQILGIGVVIPEPGEPGSYLNLGMYGPSAILPYEAGDNFVISNNTITRTPYQSWYNDYISNDGGFSNAAIAVYNSNNASVTGNTISGFDVAIAEIGALNGSEFNASGNMVTDNRNDYFTAQNDDHIVLGTDAETLTYYATSQGTDLIDNFGIGDRINIVGMEPGSINGELSGNLIVDFTAGTVTAGDGSTVAANSIQVQQNATTTTLFIDTDGTENAAELQLELTGLYEVENFNLDGGFIVFAVLPPTASAQAFCDAATVADLVATGTDLKWYDVAAGGTALADNTDLSTGTYYVSQTISGEESDRTSVAVTINISPSASGVATNVSCNGGSNGAVDLTVTGGTAPYTFVWNNTATTEDLTGLSAGTYDVTVTDANGCTATASVTVTEPTILTAGGVATNVSCNGGNNGTVDLTVTGGTAPYTYAWSNTATTEDLTGLSAGTYDVTVTDANGCTATASVTVTEPTILTAGGVATNVSCNGGSNGTVDLTVTGGTAPYTYLWNNTATTEDITGLSAGTYEVTVTDANGCTATASVTVTEPVLLEVSTVVDTNVSCNGGTTGSATINLTGGTAPFEYIINGTTWSGVPDSTLAVTGLAAGIYPVFVTDSNGCTATGSVEVTEPTILSASGVATNVSCNGGSNGAVDLTVTGGTAPYTFVWNNTATTEDLTGLSAGTYEVTVTDANGCTATASVTVTEPVVLAATAAVDTGISCNGAEDGVATATVTGGTAPYSYSWSGIDNTMTVVSQGFEATGSWNYTFSPAIYNVSNDVWAIVNSVGSISSASEGDFFFGIRDLNNPNGGGTMDHTITFEPIDVSAMGDLTLSFDYYSVEFEAADVIGYVVEFDNGATWGPTVELDRNTGVWTTVNIPVPAAANFVRLRLLANQDGASDYAGFDNVMLTGAAPQTATMTGLSAGTYEVTVTDANGCSATTSVTITEPAVLSAGGIATNVSCNAGSNGAVDLTVTGGTAPY